MRYLRITLVLLFAHFAGGQGSIRLKTRTIVPDASRPGTWRLESPGAAPQHYLILFGSYPGPDVIAELQAHRALVLAYVPVNALMVSAVRLDLRGMDVLWAGPMDPSDKISPLVSKLAQGTYLVMFQPDTDAAADAAAAQDLGFTSIANSHLLPGQLLLSGAYSSLTALAALDAVAYILPASAELQDGDAIAGCAGAATALGPSPQYVAADGGWAPDASGHVTLGYFLDSVTTDLEESEIRGELARAFAVWAQYANVSISPAAAPGLARSIDILFARYAHGDAYPFYGPGGVIAHTFYPTPSNPEPLAGDMHLNADESWSIGGTLDLFSVALHETGHALGLGHSDDPTSVMYPYYRFQTGLTPDDIAGIQALYGPPATGGVAAPPVSSGTAASGNGTTPPTSNPPASSPPASGADTLPPTLTITYPSASMVSASSPTLTMSGTASDNVGVASVQWSTSTGSSGAATGTTAWTASVPLLIGNNTITVKAYDTSGNSSWRAVTVVRNQ
ncbi:MAG TPA: matrixin family metalloprotease [Bryobacteraceae bacterium]|nr:matrixin family metalloprotease [Bryobacteraceae bacterium]